MGRLIFAFCVSKRVMASKLETTHRCEQALDKLLAFCRKEGWAGYDPYDGLNSFLARALPGNQRFARTILTQLIKRSPVNLRPLVGIKKGLNAKGIALALQSLLLLANRNRSLVLSNDPGEEIETLVDLLVKLRSREYEQACWGYNFDWQSRAFFAPRGTPNVVCTVFAANALLDLFEMSGSEFAFEMAESSGRFLLDQLNRTAEAEGHCFSYTPIDRATVHNVNLLAAELLARLYSKNEDSRVRDAAEAAVRYTLARQQSDGSWFYGESQSQRWIDSFHTGFVLVSLKRIIRYLDAEDWREALRRGYDFYEQRFFLADSTPRYYHDRLYPIDVHSAAQAIITFVEMSDLMPDAPERANKAAQWAITNLQDPAGFFYFQRHRFYTIRTPFMRWAQTWMLYALSLYISKAPVSDNV